MSKKNTLKHQLGVISMIGYVAVIIVMIVFDYYLIYNFNAKTQEMYLKKMNNYIESADAAIEQADQMVLGIYNNNKNFQKLSYLEDETENYLVTYELMTQIEDQMQMNTDISGTIILYEYGEKRRYSFKETVDYEDKMQLVEFVTEHFHQNELQKEGFPVWINDNVYYVRLLTRKRVTIAAVINLTNLGEKSLNRLSEDETFILTYGETVLMGQELAGELSILQNADIKAGDKTYVNIKDASDQNYRVYPGRLEKENYALYLAVKTGRAFGCEPFHIVLILVTFLVTLFVIVLYRFLRRQILNPLRELTDSMIQIREGRRQAKLGILAPYREFEEVTEAFNSMMTEIEQLKISSYEEQIEKQHAQMQCFQLQLRPHFYLNCLKTLNYMAVMKDTENMQELIFTISTQLRYLLRNEAEMVTVREEMENVKGYIHLQELISSRKVECTFLMDEALMECMVPILCIQTFVENTFKHAVVADKQEPLHLTVRGNILMMEEKKLVDISVEDNGCGYEKEILKLINAKSYDADDGKAIGIMNLKKRCQLLYDGKAECMFYNMPGAVSELILPYLGGAQ